TPLYLRALAMPAPLPRPPPFPYTTLFRSVGRELRALGGRGQVLCVTHLPQVAGQAHHHLRVTKLTDGRTTRTTVAELTTEDRVRSEEHTSELQSLRHLVCRLLLEKKK